MSLAGKMNVTTLCVCVCVGGGERSYSYYIVPSDGDEAKYKRIFGFEQTNFA
jgi:hypothetical protein